jgi:hypothetical protein
MAGYKVPQDVEADDKLIGPFSFRQFIYLIIVAIAGFIGYLLSKVFIGLAIIVLPIIVLFGAIALPLRKEQPMETYLVAVVRFFLKPRVRMWSPEGAVSMVTITAPKLVEQHLTKDFTGDEASQRLSYLAQVVDTGGWASRGLQHPNDNMSDIIVAEAQAQRDIFDEDTSVSRSFDQKINQSDEQRKQQLVSQFQQAIAQPGSTTIGSFPTDNADPTYNPYPSSMHQKVLMPIGSDQTTASPAPTIAQPPQNTTPQTLPIAPTQQQPASLPPTRPINTPPSPDIMRLANTKDLSISALAHEAHRLSGEDEGEVVISLR